MIANSKDEATSMVLVGLQALISMGASATVARCYSPSSNPDDDEDVIAAGNRQVALLRQLRTEFEDALLLGQFPDRLLQIRLQLRDWASTPQAALDNHTPMDMGVKLPF